MIFEVGERLGFKHRINCFVAVGHDGNNCIGSMVNKAKGCVALALIGGIFCILTSTI